MNLPITLALAIDWHLVLEGVLSAALVALVFVIVTRYGKAIGGFFNEVALELSKCSWPWKPQEKGLKRYKELIDSTVVVAVSSLMLAGIVTSADFILSKVVGFLTRFHI